MIVCSVVMDYYSQLERVRRDTLMELQASVRSIYESLGARIQTRAHPVSASFSDARPFSLFLAAEAIGRVERLLEERERTLRGAVVCVHRCDSSEEAARVYGTLRLNHKNPYGIRFSDQARASLRGYFDFKKAGTAGKWLYPVHVDMARGVDAAVLFSERSSPDPAWRVLPELLASGSRVLALEGYKPTRSLDAIADALSTHAPAARVVRLRACPSATMPFSPLMAAFSRAETDRSGMEETGREAGDATDKAFRLVARSLFADGKDRVLMTGCAEYIHDRLDDDGGRDTIALCDMPGQYSPEAQALVAERLRANRGRERYAILCPGNTPDAWQGAKPIVIPVEAPKQDVFEEAMLKALGESEEPLRGLLEQRFAALSGKRKHADQHAKSSGTLLSSLPEEAALYLYATLIAEGILETELLNEFLERMGLVPEGAKPLRELLSRCGFLDPSAPAKVLRPLSASAVVHAAKKTNAELIDAEFTRFLEELYARKEIEPSLGLLYRIGENQRNESITFDCVYADALSLSNGYPLRADALSRPAATMYWFLRALRDRDRERAELESAKMGAIEAPQAALLKGLAMAELAYASGDAERSAKASRQALLAVTREGPAKLEIRAHRLMGLSSLAAGKYTEAADYLGNALELAESSGDSYERFMASYTRAIGEFMSGSLVRSASMAESAAKFAVSGFRMDHACAASFLLARIQLDLGDYDDAARRFDAIRDTALRYGFDDIATRAAIWRGRALAYAGDNAQAVGILLGVEDDPEASVFLGEIAILQGDEKRALDWLSLSREASTRPFHPADSILWSSAFSEMEGRCMAFDDAGFALEELRKVLELYARGASERDPSCASELYALTRGEGTSKTGPGASTYSYLCYELEGRFASPPVDRQTVLSRAFKALQQRAGKIEERSKRALYMEKNYWNRRLIEAAREHKFI